MKKIVAVVLFPIMFLVACSAGTNIKKSSVQQIQKGVTTEQQIVSMFGEPHGSQLDFKSNLKTLTYQYDNNDSIKKDVASAMGVAVGGAAFGLLGAVGGKAVGSNSINARKESKLLRVKMDTRTSKVVDFDYISTQGRTRSIGTGTAIDGVGEH